MFKGEDDIAKIVLHINNCTYINFKYMCGNGHINFSEY